MSKIVCTSCGYVGQVKKNTKGSFAIELILWLCFIIPGVIYSFWRLSSRHDVCPSCNSKNLIPFDSPMGKKFITDNSLDQASKTPEESRMTGKAAHSTGRALGKLAGKMFK